MHGSAQGRQVAFPLHHDAQQETQARKTGNQEIQSGAPSSHAAPRNQVTVMPRKTNKEKNDRRGSRRSGPQTERRTPRPKPKIDFTIDALDFKNTTLFRQFVTDQGRILPRKYTGLPAHYQRRLNRAIKRARQMLLMK